MQLIVNFPDKLLDALQESAEQFEHEAKMAMAESFMNLGGFPAEQLPY